MSDKLPDDVLAVKVRLVKGRPVPEFLIMKFEMEEETPPPSRWPVGKGYFMWNLSRCAGGNFVKATQMAKDAGLKWVAIKVTNGEAVFNNVNIDVMNWVASFKQAGIGVWGWGYVYGVNPNLEANVAIRQVSKFGLDGFIVNAEHEYKHPSKVASARLYMDMLRAGLKDLGIGLCSYRYPSLHRELPWTEFLEKSDFHCPQVYWIGASPLSVAVAGSQLARSMAELKALKDLPVVPVGVASPNDNDTWRPTVAQLDNFAASASRLPGHGWWSWEHAERISPFWEAISRHS